MNPHDILKTLKRIQLHEWIHLEDPYPALWVDHVMYDIPNTVLGAIQSAPDYVKAVTIHMDIAGHWKYEEVPKLCRKKDIILMVALPPTFDRVLYEEWMNLKKWKWYE